MFAGPQVLRGHAPGHPAQQPAAALRAAAHQGQRAELRLARSGLRAGHRAERVRHDEWALSTSVILAISSSIFRVFYIVSNSSTYSIVSKRVLYTLYRVPTE